MSRSNNWPIVETSIMSSIKSDNCLSFLKTVIIVLSIALFCFYFYYLIIVLKDDPNGQIEPKSLFFVLISFRIISMIITISILLASNAINKTIVVTFAIINPIFELIIFIFSSFVIKYHKNIFGLVVQLIYVYVISVYGIKSILNKLMTQNDNLKKGSIKVVKEIEKQSEVIDAKEISDNKTDPNIDDKQIADYFSIESCLNQNFLAICSVIAIVLTLISGIVLRYVANDSQMSVIWTKNSLRYLGYPGELFLRVLNCLIIPLIFSSLVYALADVDIKNSMKIAIRISIFYFITTFIAVFLGIVLVSLIKPGNSDSFSDKVGTESTDLSIIDIFMDLFRNIFTDNLFRSTFQSYKSEIKTIRNSSENTTIETEVGESHTNQTNILGIITSALVFGITISAFSDECRVLVQVFSALNTVVIKITEFVVNLAPIAIIFLVLPQILSVDDFGILMEKVGLYTLTVIIGLAIHMMIILPLIYFALTQKNPFSFMLNMLSAMTMAFGTASSSATMPTTMKCLEQNNCVNEKVVRFCIPIGATINMDGTALYEAVSAIFIAQTIGKELTLVELVVVSVTATLASIGAAGVPQAGLITIVIVLNALGLPKHLAGFVMIIDWFLDRFRTVVNVMGDSYGAAIVNHLISKNL